MILANQLIIIKEKKLIIKFIDTQLEVKKLQIKIVKV